MLVAKYERKDVFNQRIYTEDKKENETLSDIKKAFHLLKSDNSIAIQINNTVLFWESILNFEYLTLTAREYDKNGNYHEFLWDYEGCKNNYYTIYKNVA